MSFTFISEPDPAARLADDLREREWIALDCEAAGFHRYSDRLCLIQITTDDDTYIVDPFAVDPTGLLRPVLEDPEIRILMHGADYDIRLLDRDLGIRIRGLFDTQVAAALLGENALGLASLLEKFLDVRLSKKYQRADWAQRPLPDDMLEYAASDTRYLPELVELLATRLDEHDRRHWAEEEFEALEGVSWDEDPDEDPVVRVKGAHELGPLEVTALREALAWRDRIARARDRALFRVVGDRALLEAARTRPDSVKELEQLKGMNRSLARDEGEALLERLRRVEELAADELVPYPRSSGNGDGRGRPPREVEERMYRLKSVRNRRASELEMDRGTLLPNAMLMEIAWEEPDSLDEMRSIDGLKDWQVEVMGTDLLQRLSD